MLRRTLFVALLAVVAHWQAAYAQTLVLPEQTPLGKKIVSTIKDLPEGAKVAYLADAGAEVAKVSGDRAHWWGIPGRHVARAVVFVDGDAEPVWATAEFVVGDAPGPGPNPPARTLAELAGKDAAILARVYATHAKDVGEGDYKTVEEFLTVHRMMLVDLELDQNGAAAEIEKRLAVQSLAELKAALEKIVSGLGADPGPGPGPTPPTPPLPAGKRHVVIVRESEDDTPDMAFLFNALRTDEPSKWLKEKGHTLAIHDDDDVDQHGNSIPLVEKLEELGPVPGLFILDQTSGTVVHKQELPRTAPEVIEAVKAH